MIRCQIARNVGKNLISGRQWRHESMCGARLLRPTEIIPTTVPISRHTQHQVRLPVGPPKFH